MVGTRPYSIQVWSHMSMFPMNWGSNNTTEHGNGRSLYFRPSASVCRLFRGVFVVFGNHKRQGSLALNSSLKILKNSEVFRYSYKNVKLVGVIDCRILALMESKRNVQVSQVKTVGLPMTWSLYCLASAYVFCWLEMETQEPKARRRRFWRNSCFFFWPCFTLNAPAKRFFELRCMTINWNVEKTEWGHKTQR